MNDIVKMLAPLTVMICRIWVLFIEDAKGGTFAHPLYYYTNTLFSFYFVDNQKRPSIQSKGECTS